jgi:hypothetical protein
VSFLAVFLASCAAAPSRQAAEAAREPLATISGIFAETTSGLPDATPIHENEVVSVSETAITWRALRQRGAPLRTLRFSDVAGVDRHEGSAEYPTHTEMVFIFVGGPDAAAAGAQLQVPAGRPYVELRNRPLGSAARLRAALQALGYLSSG